jgi:toxin CptA
LSASIRFQLQPSLRLAAAILLAHAAAAWSAWIVLGGAAGVLLAAALASLGMAAAWSRALLRSRGSVRAILVAASGQQLELAGGESLPVELGERRYVTRWLVTLPVRRPVRRTILVTADMLDADSFRRLRLWALWGKLPVARGQLGGGQTALH